MSDPLKSTDQYYRSKRPGSAIQHSAADSVRKPGQKQLPPGVTPVATPAFNREDTTTDKYYAAGGSKVGAAGQPVAPRPAAMRADVVLNDLLVVEIADAAGLAHGLVATKQHAARGGRVQIAVADPALVARVNTALDGAVSREEITEGQRRDIRVGVRKAGADLPAPAAAPAPPPFDPAAFLTAAPAARAEAPLDVDAFLAAGATDDEDEKLAAITGGSPAGARPPEPESRPEPEDNDFDLGETPAVGTTPSPETLAGDAA